MYLNNFRITLKTILTVESVQMVVRMGREFDMVTTIKTTTIYRDACVIF